MTRPLPPSPHGLGALGETLLRNTLNPSAEFDFSSPGVWQAMVARLRRAPPEGCDAALFAAQQALGFSDAELLAAALACRVESEPQFAGFIASFQSPGAVGRLTFGMLGRVLGLKPRDLAELCGGKAIQSGLLVRGKEELPLPGQSLTVTAPVMGALLGQVDMEGAPLPLDAPGIRFTDKDEAELQALGRWAKSGCSRTVFLRGADPAELRAAACFVAHSIGSIARTCGVSDELPGAWLHLANAVPVITLPKAPEPPALPSRQLFNGPAIVLVDAHMQAPDASNNTREWIAQIPDCTERERLWRSAGLAKESAKEAARLYRQGAGSIFRMAGRITGESDDSDLTAVAAQVAIGSEALDNLAQRSRTQKIDRDALILPKGLSTQIENLRQRILRREQLGSNLGPAITARYRPGVRALMTGESGTGKTLAAHWLASSLGLPLYRADMAALTSKWIGETEKNISQLLSVAETSDCILFFDEADALFGARTDVSDANDRHANAQTNFLLQRIEDFDGIAVLSTNSRDRFDAAFVRRLDAILEFPLPDAAARANLWRAHLGDGHDLAEGQIERLARSVEMAGGHIRNAVLGAALRARITGTPIGIEHISAALEEECDKLGLPRPGDLG